MFKDSAILSGATVMIASILLVTPGLALTPEDSARLDSIRQMREAVTAGFTSGQGEAKCAETIKEGDEVKKAASMDVAFTFNGHNSLYFITPSEKSTTEPRAVLRKQARETVLYKSVGNKPPAVRISEIRRRRTLFNPEVENWSYEEFAAIPCVGESFWQLVKDSPSVAIAKQGDAITVKVDLRNAYTTPGPIISDNCTITFDMSVGGMVTEWSEERTDNRHDEPLLTMAESGRQSWSEHDGAMMPQSRHKEVIVNTGGTKQILSADLKVANMNSCKVSDTELTVERLGIPLGTIVVDDINKVEYRYGTEGSFGHEVDDLASLDGATSSQVGAGLGGGKETTPLGPHGRELAGNRHSQTDAGVQKHDGVGSTISITWGVLSLIFGAVALCAALIILKRKHT